MPRKHLLLLPFLLLAAADDKPSATTPPPDGTVTDVIGYFIDRAAAGEAPPADPLPADDPRHEHVNPWVKGTAEALTGVTRSPLPEQPWGKVTMRIGKDEQPTRLYLFEFNHHGRAQLIVYGLGGQVRRAYWLGSAEAATADIPVTRTERATVPSPPRQNGQLPKGYVSVPLVYVLEIDNDEPTVVPLSVQPAEDGTITLHARDVIVHGVAVRYEPEPHKNTVGYWMRQDDWVRWELEVKKPGPYSVQILQGCGPGSGGSEVEMSVGDGADQKLRFTVQETKGFQDFIARDVGKLAFPEAGVYSLKVKPLRKPGVAVMDLRMVTLKPNAE